MKAGAVAALAVALLALPAQAGVQPVTSRQLALMPLSKAALGSAAATLPLIEGSGVIPNARAAGDANGHVTAKQLAGIGRLNGYELDYQDQAGTALRQGHGLLEVKTRVDLYAGEQAAVRALAFWRKDELVPTGLQGGGLSISMTPLTIHGLGPGWFAYDRKEGIAGKAPLYGADVAFRSGRLLGFVSINAADRSESPSLAGRLALALRSRIGGVLAGRVAGSPVAVPPKAKAGPPPNGPPLDRLALTAAEVGGGKLEHEGYQVDEDLQPISEYARSFSPAVAFPFLSEEIALFHSDLEASYGIAAIGAIFGSPAAERFFKTFVGGTFSSFSSTRLSLSAGDESYAGILHVGLPNGQKVDEAFILLRVGAVTDMIVAGGLPGAVTAADVNALARKAAQKISSGLKK